MSQQSKRIELDDETDAYIWETGRDSMRFKVGCDDGPHEAETDWIECTEQGCTIWYCIPYLQEGYELTDAEIDVIKDHPDMFKCKLHGFNDLNFKKILAIQPGNSAPSSYNLRKRQKINFKDLSSSEEERPRKENVELKEFKEESDCDEDDDLDFNAMSLEQLNVWNIQQDIEKVNARINREKANKKKNTNNRSRARAKRKNPTESKSKKKKSKETMQQMIARSMFFFIFIYFHCSCMKL